MVSNPDVSYISDAGGELSVWWAFMWLIDGWIFTG